MKASLRAPIGAFFLTVIACTLPGATHAQITLPDSATSSLAGMLGEGRPRVVFSPYTHHWRYSAEHTHVWAIGAEWQRNDDWLAGASYFRNSFGQPSAYVYAGKRYDAVWAAQPELFVQWSAGMLYGYRGKFKNKVPLNYNGFSPGALASAGWAFDKRTAFTAHLLGDAGVMLQFSYDLR